MHSGLNNYNGNEYGAFSCWNCQWFKGCYGKYIWVIVVIVVAVLGRFIWLALRERVWLGLQ